MSLKYKVIHSKKQYNTYCDELEHLLIKDPKKYKEEIKLLTLLIETYQESNLAKLDPVQLLKSLMSEQDMQAVDLAEILQLSKATVSKMLNYQKGFSKQSIRCLATHFGISQEAFNRPYQLSPNDSNKKLELALI